MKSEEKKWKMAWDWSLWDEAYDWNSSFFQRYMMFLKQAKSHMLYKISHLFESVRGQKKKNILYKMILRLKEKQTWS